MARDDIPGAIFVGAMVPIFFVINAALFVAFWVAIYSLATTGAILGWTIPPGMPFWVAALILFILFIVVTSPLSAARHLSYRAYGHYPVFAIWSGLVWLSVVAFLLWIGSQHQAEIRDFVQNVPAMWRDIWCSLHARRYVPLCRSSITPGWDRRCRVQDTQDGQRRERRTPCGMNHVATTLAGSSGTVGQHGARIVSCADGRNFQGSDNEARTVSPAFSHVRL